MHHWLRYLTIATLLLGSLAWPHTAWASASLAISGSGSVQIGQQISLHVVVNTSQPVNAVDTIVSFPAHLLEVVRVENTGSQFPTDGPGSPGIDNAGGKVQIIRYALNPFNGNGGRVGTIVFKAKATGAANLSFGVSKIVAHDGQGTNVYTGGSSKSLTVTGIPAATPTPAPASQPPPSSTPQPTPIPTAGTAAPAISSTSHPDQNKWYKEKQVKLQWSGQASGFNVAIDQNPNTQLPTQIKQTTTSFQQDISGDGLWYAHVRAQSTNGWSNTAHFKIQIDSQAPTGLTIDLSPKQNISSRPTFTFSAQDSSPLTYHLQFNQDGQWHEASSPHKPQTITAGPQTVIVRATDAAGNTATAEVKFEVVAMAAPQLTRPTEGHHGPFEVEGRAQPGDKIEIYINGHLSEEKLVADDQGNFAGTTTYYKRQSDDPDLFTVKVRAINADGIASQFSPELTIPVGDYFVIGGLAGSLALPNWAGYAGISLILIVLVGTIIYLLLKLRRLSQAKGLKPNDNEFNLQPEGQTKRTLPNPWLLILAKLKREKASDERQATSDKPEEGVKRQGASVKGEPEASDERQATSDRSEESVKRESKEIDHEPRTTNHEPPATPVAGTSTSTSTSTSNEPPSQIPNSNPSFQPQALPESRIQNPESASKASPEINHEPRTTNHEPPAAPVAGTSTSTSDAPQTASDQQQSTSDEPKSQIPNSNPSFQPQALSTPVPSDAFDAVLAAEKEQSE